MSRILVVSPHFPPVNTPDMHRVRMLLPFFSQNGWSAEVLAISPAQVAAPRDPWLVEGLPPEVPVHRVNAPGLAWARVPGLGTLGYRALLPMALAGDGLIRARGFDLVYFSTTVFEVHVLGPRWKRKFGVPFVIDYQDPWVNDYYREHPEVRPPGGRVKHAIANAMHRVMEPVALRHSAGITSVSPEYPRQLARRYPWFREAACLVQPFPGSTRDFERLPDKPARTEPVDFGDGHIHWLYAGRGGMDMAKALRAFFLALASFAPEDLKRRLIIHFVGTSYAPAERATPSIAPLAENFGVADLVREYPARISYSDTLALLRSAHALIVPGSDDPGYTASKIYPYLLAARPLLAVFHERSSVTKLLGDAGGAICVDFSDGDDDGSLARRIGETWFRDGAYQRVVPLDREAFERHTDRACAAELAAFLGRCLAAP